MTREVRVGFVSEIPRGEGRAFVVDGRNIAVFHNKHGQLFATDAACPHRGGPLADGLLGGDVVVCPLHEKMFDLTTGEAIDKTCRVGVYSVVRTEDDAIAVHLPI